MSSLSSTKMMNALFVLLIFAVTLSVAPQSKAQFYGGIGGGFGMQGSGYYGGMQNCGFPQMVGTNAVSKSDDERDAEDAIKRIQADLKLAKLEQTRHDKELELLRRKIERHFEASVAEFLLDVHIEGSKLCNEYTSALPPAPPAPVAASSVSTAAVDANGNPVARATAAASVSQPVSDPLSPPPLLAGKWSRYCTATTRASAGSVSPSICQDMSLRDDAGRRSTTTSSNTCSRSLADYRKKRMDLGKSSDKVEDLESALEDAKFALTDAKARAKLDRELNKGNTEAGCPDGNCGQAGRGYVYQNSGSNMLSGLIQVGGGILASYAGRRNDQVQMEYAAQLGYPPQTNYGSLMGIPLVLSGVNTMINGGVGAGGFGCGTGASGGYYPYGMGGMGGGFGTYGPYANMGGAFGYPQGMYGAPWGGGMYNPGMNPWGGYYGPGGGFPGGLNAGFGINGMMNGMGGFGMPGMYPGMPGYGMGGPGFGIGGGFGIGAGMGGFPGMGMPGMGFPGGMGGLGGMGGMYGGNPMYGGGFGMGFPGMGAGLGGMGGFGMPGMYPGMPGYGMGGMGGYPGMGGGMGFPGGMPGMGMPGMDGGLYGGGMMGNPQYQMQILQMQQQAMQQQMQYYQAQMQQQMQAYQRQMMIQQQAVQVQQEIYSLQMRLQMIYSGAYSGGASGGAVIGSPYPLTGSPYPGMPGMPGMGMPGQPLPGQPIGPGNNATVPGVGTGIPSGGR